jgi:class 3 adenylate cyclase
MKTKVEDTLYATMDASVANLIIEGRLRTEKRNVAVMFSDLSGFTTYSEERPPELVIRDLNRYLAEIEPIILAYRGHIDKYMGDGTMCEFGAPLDSEAYRIQAVLAAIKVQERVAAGDYPWTMRIGIASGLAITGLIGSRRQTYTAIGDVVNLASRLEKLAAPGRILIDRYTYEDVARFIDAEKRRDLPLREVRDAERERQLEALHEQMTGGATDAERFYRIGQIHQELSEPWRRCSTRRRAAARCARPTCTSRWPTPRRACAWTPTAPSPSRASASASRPSRWWGCATRCPIARRSPRASTTSTATAWSGSRCRPT